MRKILLATALASGLSLPALAQDSSTRLGPYLQASIGAVQPLDSDGTVFGYDASVAFKTGVALNAGIGYRFSPNFRAEAEFGYANSSVKSVSVAGLSVSGSRLGINETIDAWSGFAAGYLDLPLGSIVTPYVGAGLGAINFSAFGGSQTHFAAFGEVGLAVQVANAVSIVPAVRYTYVDNASDGFSRTDLVIGKVGLRIGF